MRKKEILDHNIINRGRSFDQQGKKRSLHEKSPKFVDDATTQPRLVVTLLLLRHYEDPRHDCHLHIAMTVRKAARLSVHSIL